MNKCTDENLKVLEMKAKPAALSHLPPRWATAFGHPRDFLNNHFIYVVVSARTRGLSVGVNMNPNKHCNFDCIYCEVDRRAVGIPSELDVERMADELQEVLGFIHGGRLRELPSFQALPDELLNIRHVALSGDGEPTLCPIFMEAVQSVVHVRARGDFPYFKLVLVTNATGLDLPQVQAGLKFFTREDEIWAKLDAGTQEQMNRINRSVVPLDKVLANILLVGRQRPIVIQSLFPQVDDSEPNDEEIQAYTGRLLDLKNAGAQISLVQIYSAARPSMHPECGHLPLRVLSRIAQNVRAKAGLDVRVF